VFDVQGDWSPVVSGEATVVEKPTWYLMLDAGEEKAKAGGGGFHELELASRVDKG
jgi:hypothetical protein